MNPRCAPTRPLRRSFVASDARCRGQVCTVPTHPESTYRSGNAVQTTGTTSGRRGRQGSHYHDYPCLEEEDINAALTYAAAQGDHPVMRVA